MDKIWAIILAAGKSTRMKQQKLLMPFNGKAIVETVISKIMPELKSNIMVVLGSNRDEIEEKICEYQVESCFNKNYEQGMLSSVVCGFNSIPKSAKAALVFLGDQPQISTEVVRKVIKGWEQSEKGIVIPTFDGRRGHPVLIETKYKTEINQLDPEKGLRQLMQKFSDDIAEIEVGEGEILRDIDTPADYKFEVEKSNQ
ncbi:MAG TPA: nucleotidyltransferase family protein [Tangfeifania sp.]|nr:nucleotidyltransferase family protein [Tangfeifania sp.]